MSAIAGIYCFNNRPLDQTDLEHMSESLAHRGPDAKGLWKEGSVGFAHRMLWTTPESLHEKLPLVDTQAGLALIAEARLDNRDELLSCFGLSQDHQWPDSELILRA